MTVAVADSAYHLGGCNSDVCDREHNGVGAGEGGRTGADAGDSPSRPSSDGDGATHHDNGCGDASDIGVADGARCLTSDEQVRQFLGDDHSDVPLPHAVKLSFQVRVALDAWLCGCAFGQGVFALVQLGKIEASGMNDNSVDSAGLDAQTVAALYPFGTGKPYSSPLLVFLLVMAAFLLAVQFLLGTGLHGLQAAVQPCTTQRLRPRLGYSASWRGANCVNSTAGTAVRTSDNDSDGGWPDCSACEPWWAVKHWALRMRLQLVCLVAAIFAHLMQLHATFNGGAAPGLDPHFQALSELFSAFRADQTSLRALVVTFWTCNLTALVAVLFAALVWTEQLRAVEACVLVTPG